MAFSVKQIKALLSEKGMPVDNLDAAAEEICSRHTADLDSIKEQRDSYKADAEKLASVQAELDSIKNDPYEVKYSALKEEFDQYKQTQAAKETKAAKESAYRSMLKELGVSEKRLDAILRVTDLDSIVIDKSGALKDADKLRENAKTEWSDFIATTTEKGAETVTPPTNTGSKGMTPLRDIYKRDDHGRYILNAEQRQKAIAENLQQKG